MKIYQFLYMRFMSNSFSAVFDGDLHADIKQFFVINF